MIILNKVLAIKKNMLIKKINIKNKKYLTKIKIILYKLNMKGLLLKNKHNMLNKKNKYNKI